MVQFCYKNRSEMFILMKENNLPEVTSSSYSSIFNIYNVSATFVPCFSASIAKGWGSSSTLSDCYSVPE